MPASPQINDLSLKENSWTFPTGYARSCEVPCLWSYRERGS